MNKQPLQTTIYTNGTTTRFTIDSWKHSPPFIATMDAIIVPTVVIDTGDTQTLDEFVQAVRIQFEVAKRLKDGE